MGLLFQPRYEKIRDKIKPLDIIAFGGEGLISKAIKWKTGSEVSHIGIVKESVISDTERAIFVIESTSLDNYSGVVINRLSGRLRTYHGDVWVLSLSEMVRACLDVDKYKAARDFMYRQRGKAYDTKQALFAGLDWIDKIPILRLISKKISTKNFNKLFCSELVGGSLQAAGVLLKSLNPSELTPDDICRATIYKNDYWQVKGAKRRQITGFNSIGLDELASLTI